MTTLTLIRGLPGSGKSTIARRLAEANFGAVHLEADQFFEQDGEYRFDPTLLRDAHAWCQERTEDRLQGGRDVIVSNTFTQIWELVPYFDLAKRFGIVPTVITAQNQFKNIHNVPDEVLNKMRDRFQHDISRLFE